jgi:hypothetical protein
MVGVTLADALDVAAEVVVVTSTSLAVDEPREAVVEAGPSQCLIQKR